MQKLKDTNIYHMRRGGVIRIPQVFFNDHKMEDNKAIEIHRDTLPDGRDALIIIPKKSVENNNNAESSNENGKVKLPLEAELKETG